MPVNEQKLRLAVLQIRTETDYDQTMEKAHRMLAEAAAGGADIAVLPEMFACPYDRAFFKLFAARGHEETVAALAAWAREFGLILVGGSVPEREGDKLYNTAFGSAYDFYELNARAYTYFECPFGTVLSLSGRIATVDGIGGDDVPIGSRYFLGGTRYVRGFRHRALGPKALSQDYEGAVSPIGGQSLLWATAEYAVPILEQIRFALFYDVGNVWTDAYDFSFDELASSYGFGLRFDFAQFPIRLDYATVRDDPDEWARHRRFVFWIGFDN